MAWTCRLCGFRNSRNTATSREAYATRCQGCQKARNSTGGKPGRSGPPRNLNSVARPWLVFWRRRALRVQDRWILKVLDSYATDVASDKADLTETERRVLEIAQAARGATMLILAEAARRGFIRETEDGWDLHPGAKDLAKFLGLERQALADLGLGRRAKALPGPSLKEIMADYERVEPSDESSPQEPETRP